MDLALAVRPAVPEHTACVSASHPLAALQVRHCYHRLCVSEEEIDTDLGFELGFEPRNVTPEPSRNLPLGSAFCRHTLKVAMGRRWCCWITGVPWP